MASPEANATLLGRLNKRLKKTGDSEPEQAMIRLTIGILLILYYCVPWHGEASFSDVFLDTANQIIFTATVIAFTLFAAIVVNPSPSPTRRILGIFLDLTSLSILLYWTGGDHMPLFVFYLWVTLANGFRYGTMYLYISFAASVIGFGGVMTWSEYWQAHRDFAVSLMVILVLLPLYAAVLIKKLHAAISTAKQANEAKSRFLANMSHELRTPLNGVIGIGELLRETDLSKEQRSLANMMHSSANTLLELIEGVLDIAKIEAGKITIELAPFDLHSLANSVIYMLAPMGAEKDLHLSCSIDPDTPFSLEGDQQHLRQILVNLINNAIKFTDEGSVNLHIFRSGGTEENPVVRFEVIDTGIGIDPESLETIFDDFTQAKLSSSRKFEGTGLGTAISKELVELMDGRIGVDSELHKGSTFWFEIPFVALEQSDYAALSNHVLLIASEDTASAIRPSLKNWHLDFDWVQSTARAFTLLLQATEKGTPYHTVIVDQTALTDINPEQFAQMIRAEKLLSKLSLVLLNASDAMINLNRVNQYYISTLVSLDTRYLYNAIHAAQSVHVPNENVVSLAEHFKKRTRRALKVLVAEDNPVNQQVLRGIMNNVGHSVTIVDTGEQVLDAVSESIDRFDLIILDKNMPEKSGIEVIKALRFIDSSHSLPIMIITADATPEARTESLEAGADAFLTKPVEAKALLEKIAVLTDQPDSGTAEPVSAPSSGGEIEKILPADSSSLVDAQSLENLSQLGDDPSFISQLVYDFLRNGKKHIQNIRQSSKDDYLEFREALHALKGSSTELGASKLAEYCLRGESFKPFHIGSLEVSVFTREIEEVFTQTEAVLGTLIKEMDFKNYNNPE